MKIHTELAQSAVIDLVQWLDKLKKSQSASVHQLTDAMTHNLKKCTDKLEEMGVIAIKKMEALDRRLQPLLDLATEITKELMHSAESALYKPDKTLSARLEEINKNNQLLLKTTDDLLECISKTISTNEQTKKEIKNYCNYAIFNFTLLTAYNTDDATIEKILDFVRLALTSLLPGSIGSIIDGFNILKSPSLLNNADKAMYKLEQKLHALHYLSLFLEKVIHNLEIGIYEDIRYIPGKPASLEGLDLLQLNNQLN